MKLTATVTSIALLCCATYNAQERQANQKLKQLYVEQQGYLSSRPHLSLNAQYGDSLKGFEEQKVYQELLSTGLDVNELSGHMVHLKREYIKAQFGLNPQPLLHTTYGGLTSGKKKTGGATVNVAPCVNEGFEQTAVGVYTAANSVNGWTVSSRAANSICPPTNWNGGSPAFALVSTPLNNWPFNGSPIGIINHSPLGGTVVAQMNDAVIQDYEMTRLMQTFPVTSSNALFQFAYAGYWQSGGSSHNCCQQPGLDVKMYDCSGAPLTCINVSLNPGSGCSGVGFTVNTTSAGDYWSNWQLKMVDLTPYIGTCITVEFITTDCSLGGHYGTTLLDVMCGGQNITPWVPPVPGGPIPGPVSFCAGSGVAMLTAPSGYASYQWISPLTNSPVPQGTMSSLTLTNPLLGATYTVILVTASNCQYSSTVAIGYSNVMITGIGTSPSCPNGASGIATVAPHGSGAGYTYTWTNSSNQVVGTQSIATGLAPGVYTVSINGLGAAGCGSAAATTTVFSAPTTTYSVITPYCGNPAYLQTSGGTNYQWYSGTTPITGTAGAQSTYIVQNPSNGAQYWVRYVTPQGCKDSVHYTLASTQPGNIAVPTNSIKVICPGASNGSAAIVMVPAGGAPTGFSTYSVTSTGTTAPYTATLGPTSQNTFAIGGLSAGSYTVQTFDGSCRYSTNFVIAPYVYNYTLTPMTATLCPGNSIPAAVNFTANVLPNQYSYTWTPTNWLVGGNGNLQQTLITPVGVPVGGVVTTVYTVNVRPAVANCVITKTMAITSVNPPIPTFSTIPGLCNTFLPHQIVATPGGGTFINAVSTPTLVGPSSGIINPVNGPFGVHNFTYAISVNTCVATSTANFEISQFFSSALTSTVAPLCVTNGPVNLMNIVQQPSGTWAMKPNSGQPNAIQGNAFNPGGLATGVYTVEYNTVSQPNPNTCPSTTSQTISVTHTLIPSIAMVDPFCTNHTPINMTVSPAGGAWSGQNISVTGIITPSNILQPGLSIVSYTVADGPCLNYASTSFNVFRYNSSAISGTVNELCYNSNPFNLMSIVSNTTGAWAGAGIQPGSSFFTPSGWMQTDVYTLTYNTVSTPPGGPCPESSSIQVAVLNPPTPNITQLGPLCSKGKPVQLTVSPGGGKWTVSNFLDADGQFNPAMAAVGNNAVQYVIGTSNCNAKQTKFISVEAFVSADIAAAHLPDLCNTGAAINLMPYAANSSGNWYGTGIVGSSFNPGIAGKGKWVLTYTTSSIPSGLCPDEATVAVTVYSLQTPTITKAGPFCNLGTPVKLNADVQGGMYGGANTNGVNSQGLFIPATGVIGDNIINYSITAGPCVAYAQTTISVERFISADFHTLPPAFCITDNAVNMDHFVANPGGTWMGSGVVGNMFNPKLASPGNNNEVTYYTYSSPTKSLCPDERKVRIEVVELPELTALANVDKGCAPLEVWFNTPNINQGTAEWVTGDGGETKEGYSVSHVYTTPGTYSVMMSYSLKGCKAQVDLARNITVYETPVADFEMPDEVLISSPEVQFVNKSTPVGGNTYSWKIEGVNEIPAEVSPRVQMPEIGRYTVILIAENANGCKDESVKYIIVKNDFDVFIPASFSPNFDRLNDIFIPVFSPYGLDAKSFEMEIFDRWGHSIYHTTDLAKGWDGSAGKKGEPLAEGTYVYKIRYKDLDGHAFNKIGHVSILK